jgi:hypothetical protein
LPDTLDQVEHVGAFLVADGIAENAPEQPYIFPQPRVLFGRLPVIGAVGPDLGVGRHDLGGHGLSLQKQPGNSAVCNFFASAQAEERGGPSWQLHVPDAVPRFTSRASQQLSFRRKPEPITTAVSVAKVRYDLA